MNVGIKGVKHIKMGVDLTYKVTKTYFIIILAWHKGQFVSLSRILQLNGTRSCY